MTNELLTEAERKLRSTDKDKYHWTSIPDMVADSDNCGFSDREQMLRRLNEFRTQHSMTDFFFNEPEEGQSNDPDDTWTWGPNPETEVDWTGFPIDEIEK